MFPNLKVIPFLILLMALMVTPARGTEFSLSQDVYIVPVDGTSITVDHTFTEEGKGVLFVFNYILEEGTIILWDIISDGIPGTLFDILIYDDIQDPFTSGIANYYDMWDADSSVEIPYSGIWFIALRHSRGHGDYTLHISGTIEQTGTIPPDVPTDSTNTFPTAVNIPDTPDVVTPTLWILSVAGVITVISGLIYWKSEKLFTSPRKETRVIPEMSVPKDKMELALKEIEDQFSQKRKVDVPTLRDGLFSAVSVSYDTVTEIILVLIENRMLVQKADNTYSMTPDYNKQKEALLSFLE